MKKRIKQSDLSLTPKLIGNINNAETTPQTSLFDCDMTRTCNETQVLWIIVQFQLRHVIHIHQIVIRPVLIVKRRKTNVRQSNYVVQIDVILSGDVWRLWIVYQVIVKLRHRMINV